MATSVIVGLNYATTASASVFSIPNVSSPKVIGMMPSGTKVAFQQILPIGSRVFCKMTSAGSPTFQKNGKGEYVNASGYWLLQSQVAIYNSHNGSSSATATTVSGTKFVISDIKTESSLYYTVKKNYTWATYQGPSAKDFATSTKYSSGEKIRIYATYRDASGNTWGSPNSGYTAWGIITSNTGKTYPSLVLDQTVQSGTTSTGGIQTNVKLDSAGNATDATDATYINMDAVMSNLESCAQNMSKTDMDSIQALYNMQYAIGIPPKITRTADIPYMENETFPNNFGRCYTEMFMMGNCVFSIQPCKVKYLPGFNTDQKDHFWETVADSLGNNMGDDSNVEKGDLGGQLFEAQCDYNEYINTVNILARVIATYLGIGDKTYMNTGISYRNMDYSWYKIKQKKAGSADGSLFGMVTDAVRATANTLVTSAINDDTYLHFYMTADGTGYSDNMSVSTKSTGLESLFNNNLSEIASDIQFLSGNRSDVVTKADEAIKSVTEGIMGGSALGTTLGNLAKHGANYLNGGRLVFPQMIDDCTYDRSYSGTCRFISPSGDVEAIFLNCYLPICYLWPYVLPQMLSENMYRYPFLARVNAKGLFHCDLAAITGLKLQRGGQEGNCWTADGLPFEIDASFDVTPLYSKLMATSARHPILFLSNSALQEYLGSMCGVSFTGDQIRLKLGIVTTLLKNEITETIPSLLRGYYSSGATNWLRKLFNF